MPEEEGKTREANVVQEEATPTGNEQGSEYSIASSLAHQTLSSRCGQREIVVNGLCSAPPSFGSMAADLGQTPYELATLLAPISEDWILVSPCTNLSARERG